MSEPPSRSAIPACWLNADLHSHSVASDGTLRPDELATRARAGGVDLWALTDHDELAGQQRALESARQAGVGYLCGVEISVSFAGETVHIVGLGIDPGHTPLVEGLARVRQGRRVRAQAMGDSLARAGIRGAYEGAMAIAPNPDLVARTHFARFLVDTGICNDTYEVFRRYLVAGKPGYVRHQWASLRDAVHWIVGSGGVAVIAHPARYRLTANEEYALFTEFKAHGGRAVEVVTGSHSQADMLRYADAAREFGLLASRGSDFHDPHESRTGLGAGPVLPADLNPVWDSLTHRIH